MLFASKAQPVALDGGTSHRHLDAGSFVLNWGGELLLTDPGLAMKPSHEASLTDQQLRRFGCDVSITSEEFATLSDFTLFSPGHNTITLETSEGDRIFQETFDVATTQIELGSPNLFIETDYGAAYQDDNGQVLDFGGRRVIGHLPDVLLVHDRVDVAEGASPMRARFHLHSRNVDATRLEPVRESITRLSASTALLGTEGGTKQLRVRASGNTDVVATPTSDVPCMGEYLGVTNQEPQESVQLFTLILPEAVDATEPTISVLDGDTYSGFRVVRDDVTITVALARFGETFSPGNGLNLVGGILIDRAGEMETYMVEAPAGAAIGGTVDSGLAKEFARALGQRARAATDAGNDHASGNDNARLDLDANGIVTAADVAIVVDYLNNSSSVTVEGLDANGDGRVTPMDALQVINYLNSAAPQPELTLITDTPPIVDESVTESQVQAAMDADQRDQPLSDELGFTQVRV